MDTQMAYSYCKSTEDFGDTAISLLGSQSENKSLLCNTIKELLVAINNIKIHSKKRRGVKLKLNRVTVVKYFLFVIEYFCTRKK